MCVCVGAHADVMHELNDVLVAMQHDVDISLQITTIMMESE